MAGHETNDGIEYVKSLFGGSSIDTTQSGPMSQTDEFAPVISAVQDTPANNPTFEEPPQAVPVFAPRSANTVSPTVDIKPGKHPLLPGVSSYVVVIDEKRNTKIRDYDRQKYSFLAELMSDVPASEIGMTTPLKPVIPTLKTIKPVPQEVPLHDIVFQEPVTIKNAKKKKTMSEIWLTFERNAVRTAKVAKTAGVLAVAGLALSTGYKAGGGPSLFEDGILSAPKNISLDLQMAIQNPGSTLFAQPRRLFGKSK